MQLYEEHALRPEVGKYLERTLYGVVKKLATYFNDKYIKDEEFGEEVSPDMAFRTVLDDMREKGREEGREEGLEIMFISAVLSGIQNGQLQTMAEKSGISPQREKELIFIAAVIADTPEEALQSIAKEAEINIKRLQDLIAEAKTIAKTNFKK